MSEFPRTLKIATVWLVVGLLVFLGFQALEAHQQRPRISQENGGIELRRSPDGHYYWPGRLNGQEVVFLVDTGATRTALPRELADRLGLPAEGRVRSQTAGGLVEGHISRVDLTLQGGVQAEKLRVAVLPDLGSPLLGMDVLGKLHLSQQGGLLRIDLRSTSRQP